MGSSFGIISQTGNNIQTKGLILYNDPAYHKCFVTESLNSFNLAVYPEWQNASGSLTPTGSLINGVQWTSSYNGVWNFDGTDDHIQFGIPNNSSSAIFNEQDFTIEFWFNSPLDKSYNILWSYPDGAYPGYYVQHLRTQGEGTFFGYNEGLDTGDNLVVTTYRFQANEWMHVAAGSNRQNSEVFIYVHNTGSISTYATETTAADIEYVNATASIGNHQFGDFKGFIGPVRFYNRALSQEELDQNHEAEIGRFRS